MIFVFTGTFILLKVTYEDLYKNWERQKYGINCGQLNQYEIKNRNDFYFIYTEYYNETSSQFTVYHFAYWQFIVSDLRLTYKWVYDFVYWQFVVSDLRMTCKWFYDFVYWQSVVRLTYKWVYDFVYWQSVVRMTYKCVYDFVCRQSVVSNIRLIYERVYEKAFWLIVKYIHQVLLRLLTKAGEMIVH